MRTDDNQLDLFKERQQITTTLQKSRGGIFLWVKLPEFVNINNLKILAKERGVDYSSGNSFRPDNKEIKYLRLSYARLPLNDIQEGVKILPGCIRDAS